tara:strand:- start:271 stop:471 length:201 start_codon:yes stop_codon:yes gene_type:complete
MNQKQYTELVKRCIKKGQVTAATPLQMPVMQRFTTKRPEAPETSETEDYSLGSDNMKKIFKNLLQN